MVRFTFEWVALQTSEASHDLRRSAFRHPSRYQIWPSEAGPAQPRERHVPADDWAEAGYGNVRIVDPDGIEHDRCRFRETLMVVKQARQRALSGLTAS